MYYVRKRNVRIIYQKNTSWKNETTRGKKKYCVKEYHGWERYFPLCLWMNLIKKAFHLFEEKRK